MTSQAAAIQFMTNWQEVLSGEIQRGQPLRIEFDPQRLPQCRQSYRGAAMWDIILFGRFHPAGEFYTASLTQGVSSPGGMTVDRQPIPFELGVPTDATQLELWFQNKDTYGSGCVTWDSRYKQNYWFDISGEAPRARQNVAYRVGAIPDGSMVNVQGTILQKRNEFPTPASGPRVGKDIQVWLMLSAWVRNVAYQKNVWTDVHLFDDQDNLIQAETFALQWTVPEAGNGDSFQFNGKVYQGTTATPGSVSPKPDARKLQFRLYFEVNKQVYTDDVLHELALSSDAMTP